MGGRMSTQAAGAPDHVIVTARDEAARIEATLAALAQAFPGARLWVADDASRDATAAVARAAGAQVVSSVQRVGKGGAATLAARRVLGQPGAVVLLCDADLGASARHLRPLCDAVRDGRADLAVAAFARRVGGGLGVAVGFARWAVRRCCGLHTRAPISGQRALRREVLEATLPFAPRFGMEIGMTIDAVRAGFCLLELPLELEHRPTGRTPGDFLHRGRQLGDFALAYAARRRGRAS
jgi:glycosyltransferase involved in cell wall biosynthesis